VCLFRSLTLKDEFRSSKSPEPFDRRRIANELVALREPIILIIADAGIKPV
jgi:hypothetical protein